MVIKRIICLMEAHGHPEVCRTCACVKVEPSIPPPCVDCGRYDRAMNGRRCWKCYQLLEREMEDVRDDVRALTMDDLGVSSRTKA